MSLQVKLNAVKADFEAKAPASAVAALRRATDELITSGQAQRALKAGDRAPDFTLPDPEGKPVALKELLQKGPVVLTFYRGVWCLYCGLDLRTLEAASAEIRALGASMAAISMQTAPNSRRSQRINNLSFPILGDRGGDVAAAFGIRWDLPEYLREVHEQLGADVTIVTGESSWTLPMPARYVIGQDGVIAYAEINPDYTQRPDPSELMPVLQKLQAQTV